MVLDTVHSCLSLPARVYVSQNMRNVVCIITDTSCSSSAPFIMNDWYYGGFTSPYWPSDYPDRATCSWLLQSALVRPSVYYALIKSFQTIL